MEPPFYSSVDVEEAWATLGFLRRHGWPQTALRFYLGPELTVEGLAVAGEGEDEVHLVITFKPILLSDTVAGFYISRITLSEDRELGADAMPEWAKVHNITYSEFERGLPELLAAQA